ncbi:MAG: DNA helicase RecG, partial [Clostridiales bacterium]|nr:DNA helicase RecG [Clostridiales bacterium]
SAEQEYKELRAGPLADLRLALAHGRQKPADKEAAFAAFAGGAIDVLVSTSVVEVGVNVPNASVMVIEGADRFGLSQLHQLRGRVGRGAARSWCFLMAEPSDRLNLLASTNDGFEIARKDLELRGPGDLIGFRQAGVAGGIGAMGDMRLFAEAAGEARILTRDPDAPGARRLIELAREQLNRRMEGVAMN